MHVRLPSVRVGRAGVYHEISTYVFSLTLMKMPPSFKADVLSDIQVELLPRTAYSVRDPLSRCALGIALERQQGVHAIGTDRRADFDTWPGTLAYTPLGVDVFSESGDGGEYLVVRWTSGDVPGLDGTSNHRRQWAPHGAALRQAHGLRRLLLANERDDLAIEQATLEFISLERGKMVLPDQRMRTVYRQVLERITAEFDQQLSIAQLAFSVGKTPLVFLREFTRMVGITPHAFIVETRVQAARALIQGGQLPLSRIAADCGFAHQSHMGVAFRKVLGQTPCGYRATSARADRC